MQIDAQTIIDKLTNNFAAELAAAKRDAAVAEVQIDALQEENQKLSAELESYRNAQNSDGPIEGEVVG